MLIILKLTTECNLRCTYCSEGNQEPSRLDESVFYKVVDDLPQLLTVIKDDKVDFLFHGGEPLLYGQEALSKLMEYARKNLPDIETKFLMQTNGTLINERWISFFKEEQISVGVSIDGYDEIHDKYRRTKQNEPTAQLVFNNIEKMQNAGICVGTLMVVNSEDGISAEKLYDFICNYHLNMKIHSVVPCGRASGREDTDKVYEQYLALLRQLLDIILKKNMQVSVQPLDALLDGILGLSHMRECSYNGKCGSGLLCVYPDGEVGFCGRDNLSRQFIYGSIKDKTILELYQSSNAQFIRSRQAFLEKNDCLNCKEWELCHGGCAYEAFNSFDTLLAKNAHCQQWREFIHYLRTEGLFKFKKALISEKSKHREILQDKKKIVRDIQEIQLDGGVN